MLYEGYKFYTIREGKEGKVFWRCELHKAGCKGRATSVEGWKVVGKAHPNIFEVFEVMRKEQASSEMKLEQLELGGRAPPRKKRCIEKDNRISSLFQRFKDGQYS